MSKRVAAYLRISLDQDGEKFGVETQRQRIAAEAAHRGWTIAREFVDNSVSASKARGKGTAWHDMIESVGKGEFDVIVAVDLDRLLRQTKDLVTLIDAGAKVLTLDGEIDLSTPDGELRATMLTAFARFEVRHKAERRKRANAHRRREGTPTKVALKILGFTRDGLATVEDEAEAVKGVYTSFLAGVSLKQLARDLTQLGYLTSKGRPFNAHSVRIMLKNPRYMGQILHHETGELFPGRFPAIVSKDMWDEVQMKLADPSRRKSKGNEPTALLSSIAYCGKCLERSIKVGRADWIFYRCNSGHVSRSLTLVDAMVNTAVITRLSMPDAISLFTPKRNESVDREALSTERLTSVSRLRGLAALYTEGVLDQDSVREQSALLNARINEIDGLLDATPPPEWITKVINAADVHAAWCDLDLSRRRTVVDALMTVTIMPTERRGRGAFNPESVRIEPKK
ncbi:recombinase family protein [Arthrobacter bambusae]|uniref:DNA invertase Pin-like site-specific DNA recombinase n=1 Tax=Arthrobacter bambusae TaxID=1338426 RepID=A0AAW8DGJ5_9MICC|nr:recombinase family protein [Arthrobacter bambusae]MDP9904787.1 DNA invertase Pin-like site-specific DNA recombinase [Arthrobacter bambusae]MDQ0129603.1 DNA invertase Pin-like site-specific DNA recombinase [Arthrobacter bambusae]MDQ0180784.1 DNA invertase Pin-like site-specific DNA recombinase [Arthrobacter bambusae]